MCDTSGIFQVLYVGDKIGYEAIRESDLTFKVTELENVHSFSILSTWLEMPSTGKHPDNLDDLFEYLKSNGQYNDIIIFTELQRKIIPKFKKDVTNFDGKIALLNFLGPAIEKDILEHVDLYGTTSNIEEFIDGLVKLLKE